ncbi:MAG: ATP-binding protein [Acidimicrobiaceae bacterium]|nr:ATP-binding protein [Acidimicrobiaceae bacterium]
MTTTPCLTTFDLRKLADFAGRLETAESQDTACGLDLSDEAISDQSNPSAVRLSIPSIMVVANLLVSRFRDVAITVQIPDSKGLNLQLARGGFFFALANRPRVSWTDKPPEEWNNVEKAWVNPFHPNDVKMRRAALVDVQNPDNDAWVIRAAFQRYLLSVPHPHTRPARHLRQELHRIANLWLSRRLRIKPGSEMVKTLVDCVEVFYQIVVNIPDHASLGSNTAGCSLGQVYLTLGGGRESHNRLHFTVLDSGVGIPRRVKAIYKDRSRKAEEALHDAVMGDLPRQVGGRGVGLTLVRQIANQYTDDVSNIRGASSIHIVTNGDSDHSASCLEWNSESENPGTSSVEGLPIRGTLIWVSLGLQNRIPDEDSHQLELTFTEPIIG